MATATADKLPPAAYRAILDLTATEEERDEANLLGKGFLRRRQGMLFIGATGIGKSSNLVQGQINWALGKPHFGIKPQRELTSLYVQAENDDIDLCEMRDGILAGIGLSDAERAEVAKRLYVSTEHARGVDLFAKLKGPVEELKPDLLVIDPLFAFLTSSASDQEATSLFLRGLLQPFLVKHNLGAIIAHHSNKPASGKEKSTWQAGDFAYAGSGSAELANWARSVLYLRSIGSRDVFELRAAKRAKRIGWEDLDGNSEDVRRVKHSTKGGIFWEEATAGEATAGEQPKRKGDGEAGKIVRTFFKAGGSKDRSVPQEKLAAKLEMSVRNLHRKFTDYRLSYDGDTLELRTGDVFLVWEGGP